jgi:hypothetical protein
LAYRLALNSLLEALETYEAVAAELRPSSATGVRALGDAVASGDAGGAEEAARRLLDADRG